MITLYNQFIFPREITEKESHQYGSRNKSVWSKEELSLFDSNLFPNNTVCIIEDKIHINGSAFHMPSITINKKTRTETKLQRKKIYRRYLFQFIKIDDEYFLIRFSKIKITHARNKLTHDGYYVGNKEVSKNEEINRRYFLADQTIELKSFLDKINSFSKSSKIIF